MHGRQDREHGEGGFALIELLIVTQIVAILITLAMPTSLAARNRAHDRAAQVRLMNAHKAARSSYAHKGAYTADRHLMEAEEPSINWMDMDNYTNEEYQKAEKEYVYIYPCFGQQTGAPFDPVTGVDAQMLFLVVKSPTEAHFAIKDVAFGANTRVSFYTWRPEINAAGTWFDCDTTPGPTAFT